MALLLIAIALVTWAVEAREPKPKATSAAARRDEHLGGLALGAILFLEFTALALPNVVARWAGIAMQASCPGCWRRPLALVPEVWTRRAASWACWTARIAVAGRCWRCCWSSGGSTTGCWQAALVFAQFRSG